MPPDPTPCMDETDERLATAADDLAETLEELRGELREPPRGPLGLPRPPSPRELLEFTEAYTIPALISLLETSIRVLELLAAAIRLAEGRPLDGDARRRADRLAAASRGTLEKLDDALADLQDAAAGGQPDNPEVRRLLEEARRLRAEVDQRLADATADPESGPAGEGPAPDPESNGEGDADEEPAIDIDVDQELESIKRNLDADDDDE